MHFIFQLCKQHWHCNKNFLVSDRYLTLTYPVQIKKKHVTYFFLIFFFLASGGTRQGPCGRGCPDKNVPQKTESQTVLFVQRHTCLWEYCYKQEEI